MPDPNSRSPILNDIKTNFPTQNSSINLNLTQAFRPDYEPVR